MSDHTYIETRISASQIAYALRCDPGLFAAVVRHLHQCSEWDAPDFGFAATATAPTKGETVALQQALKGIAAGSSRMLKELA